MQIHHFYHNFEFTYNKLKFKKILASFTLRNMSNIVLPLHSSPLTIILAKDEIDRNMLRVAQLSRGGGCVGQVTIQ